MLFKRCVPTITYSYIVEHQHFLNNRKHIILRTEEVTIWIRRQKSTFGCTTSHIMQDRRFFSIQQHQVSREHAGSTEEQSVTPLSRSCYHNYSEQVQQKYAVKHTCTLTQCYSREGTELGKHINVYGRNLVFTQQVICFNQCLPRSQSMQITMNDQDVTEARFQYNQEQHPDLT